jgi:hypothetical protein
VSTLLTGPSQPEAPDHPKADRLVARPGLGRSETLNRAVRLVEGGHRRKGEGSSRMVIAIRAGGARPGDGLVPTDGWALADPVVGAVQARAETVGAGPVEPARPYNDAGLGNAVHELPSAWRSSDRSGEGTGPRARRVGQ